MSDKKRETTFEEDLAQLEEIVRLLERGEAPLAESLALFEEGTRLTAACQGALERAEQLVVKLQKGPDGEPIERPFEEEA